MTFHTTICLDHVIFFGLGFLILSEFSSNGTPLSTNITIYWGRIYGFFFVILTTSGDFVLLSVAKFSLASLVGSGPFCVGLPSIDPVWPCLPLFDPLWSLPPHLTPFYPVLPHLTPFDPVGPRLTLFDKIAVCASF